VERGVRVRWEWEVGEEGYFCSLGRHVWIWFERKEVMVGRSYVYKLKMRKIPSVCWLYVLFPPIALLIPRALLLCMY
jgi:hypothetical protein